MHSAQILNVVLCKGASALKLLPCEDDTLIVVWDARPVLDLLLHVIDGVIRGKVKGDCRSTQGLDEDAHVL